jgi:mitogen-activated protein kinase kinase 1
LVECALGRFPYPSNSGGKTSKDKEDIAKQMANLGFWELVDFIVKEPPPKLPSEKFSVEFCDLIDLW